jgi:hypothetical protein
MRKTSSQDTSGFAMMGRGALATIIGLVITGISYSMTPDGGTYTICTGLIVCGIIYFVIGFFKMLAGR